MTTPLEKTPAVVAAEADYREARATVALLHALLRGAIDHHNETAQALGRAWQEAESEPA